MSEPRAFPPAPFSLTRLALRVAVILAIAFGVHSLMDWVMVEEAEIKSSGMMMGALVALLAAYALLIAIPFVPGVEIGITLLVLRGAEVAPVVWAATLLGLMLAFSVGRWMPYAWIHSVFVDLRMKRACDALEDLAPMSHRERIERLQTSVPRWARPISGKGRYFLLAVLINLPGSALLGGGGGIAFVAGISRLFAPVPTFIIMALSVAPVPLAVWLWGQRVLTGG